MQKANYPALYNGEDENPDQINEKNVYKNREDNVLVVNNQGRSLENREALKKVVDLGTKQIKS